MIGKIINITDSKIYLQLNINIYNSVDNLINKFVVFGNKYVGEIISISNTTCIINPLGEFINNDFISGISTMPSFNLECRLATSEEINKIFNETNTTNVINIGTSLIYNNQNITLDINNLFANHFAIFGNTGSGKSYFVAKLLQGIFYDAKKLPINTNIFLFDAYGEYQNAFNKINLVNPNLNYRVFTSDIRATSQEIITIPFWLLTIDDICLLLEVEDIRQIAILEKTMKLVTYFTKSENEVLKGKNDIIAKCIIDVIYSVQNCIEVRNKIVSILTKFSTKDINLDTQLTKGGWTRNIRQCIEIDRDGKFSDIESVIEYLNTFSENNTVLQMPDGSYMYTINDFAYCLEFALISEGIFNSNRVFDYANILKVRLNSLINSDYAKYFNFNNYIDKNGYIKYLLYKNNKKFQIINFNINYVDDRFAKVLVKIFSNLFFNFQTSISNRASFPFHIILEEAHRYVQDDIDRKILGYNIFERIAKEGRKYGLLLGLISQRPTELSSTTISQCSNFVIFKIFHEDDINFIINSVPNIKTEIINKIKILPPGSCIIFGNCYKIPILTKISIPNPVPSSNSCNINNTWYIN